MRKMVCRQSEVQELVRFVTTSLRKLEGEAEDLQGRADAVAEQHRGSLLGIQQLQETMKEMAVVGGIEIMEKLLEGHNKKMVHLTALESYLRSALDEVIGKVLGTQSRLTTLEEHLQDLSRGGDGAVLHPHPQPNHIQDAVGGLADDMALNLQRCCACSEGFPYGVILLCPCKHVYHPWCAAQWFKATSLCAHSHCGEVHTMWLKSWGFQTASDGDRAPRQHPQVQGSPTGHRQGQGSVQGDGPPVLGMSLTTSTHQ